MSLRCTAACLRLTSSCQVCVAYWGMNIAVRRHQGICSVAPRAGPTLGNASYAELACTDHHVGLLPRTQNLSRASCTLCCLPTHNLSIREVSRTVTQPVTTVAAHTAGLPAAAIMTMARSRVATMTTALSPTDRTAATTAAGAHCIK